MLSSQSKSRLSYEKGQAINLEMLSAPLNKHPNKVGKTA